MIPEGTAAGVNSANSANTSVWRFVNGSATVIEKTFGSTPFPAANVRFDLGSLASPIALSEGRLELVVTNGAAVDLPAVKVIVEYYETQARIPPFVHQAIQDQSVVRVLLQRNAIGAMDVELGGGRRRDDRLDPVGERLPRRRERGTRRAIDAVDGRSQLQSFPIAANRRRRPNGTGDSADKSGPMRRRIAQRLVTAGPR